MFLLNLIETNYPEMTVYVCKDPILFGDYRTALEENEPRLYEDVIDYDNAKALFTEVSHHLTSY